MRAMDTILTDAEQAQIKRQKRIKQVGIPVGALLLIWVISGFFTTGIDRNEIRIATVEQGSLDEAVEGSGEVKSTGIIPFYSPVAAVVKKVYRRAGDAVVPGDTILVVDGVQIQSDIAKIQDDIRIVRNDLANKQIDFDILELSNRERKDLTVTQQQLNRSEYLNARRLYKIGAISKYELETKRITLAQDSIRLKYIDRSQQLEERKLERQIETLKLSISKLESDLNLAQRRLSETVVIAPDTARVILNPVDIGTQVTNGQLLTQLNLDRQLIVNARFNQRLVDRLGVDRPAQIRIGKEYYPGKLTRLNRSVTNGMVSAEIQFTSVPPSDAVQNTQVQVTVVSNSLQNVLIVERGGFIRAGGRVAFKVDGNTANRVPIQIGAMSPTHIQIKSGLKAGDRIIISDYRDYAHLETVTIQ